MTKPLNTKKGLATLYLVAFTTLLLGVVTMSFSRIMIMDAEEASSNDLYQSAYDSALAGIEDAKIALLKYHECISTLNTSSYENVAGCQDVIRRMEEGINSDSCDVISSVLGRENKNGEVIIQETYDNDPDNDDSSFSMDQAYTCVKITEENDDYRSVFTANNRVRVIPIRSSEFANVSGIKLQWHSTNMGADDYMYDVLSGDSDVLKFADKNVAKNSAPIITMDLYQTDVNFSFYELDINNDTNTGTDHAMIMLYPESGTAGSGNGTIITARNLLDVSNKDNSVALGVTNAANSLTPKPVACGYTDGFRCRSLIEFPSTYQGHNVAYNGNPARAESTFFLRLTLPYGVPETDFSVTLCTSVNTSTGDCTPAKFTGVQAVVDSTGRASTLYRRILSRIELIDLNYPYPEFAISLNGDKDALIEKNFWVTKNCWRSDGVGGYTVCSNNGDAD